MACHMLCPALIHDWNNGRNNHGRWVWLSFDQYWLTVSRKNRLPKKNGEFHTGTQHSTQRKSGTDWRHTCNVFASEANVHWRSKWHINGSKKQNPFTALISLDNDQQNWEIWNPNAFFFFFALECERIFIKQHIDEYSIEIDALWDRKISCLLARPCSFQPGHFTGWDSEGVKR